MPAYRSISYFVEWAIHARQHFPQNLPYNELTHILYAFANIKPETGEVYIVETWSSLEIKLGDDRLGGPGGHNVFGCIEQLFLLKKKNRKLKTLLSIGGYTYSSNFAKPASTPQGRQNFARTAVQLVQDLGFDGLDIDWEYPTSNEEAKNLVLLLEEVRTALDDYATRTGSNKLLLTVASPAGPEKYKVLHLEAMNKHLDFWNLMAYDYAGSWDHIAAHQANLHHSSANPASTPFSTATAVDHYRAQSIPSHHIVLGLPLYGRDFNNTDGLGKAFSGNGTGSWERGIWDFKDLPRSGAVEHLDHAAGASYSHDTAARIVISYDTKEAVKLKTDYIAKDGLGGVMWWESSGDKSGEESLIKTAFEKLGAAGALDQTENTLHYPHSKWDNIRNASSGN